MPEHVAGVLVGIGGVVRRVGEWQPVCHAPCPDLVSDAGSRVALTKVLPGAFFGPVTVALDVKHLCT